MLSPQKHFKLKYINKGATRKVILIGNYAIKISAYPFRFHGSFLSGCLANWRERDRYKTWKFINHKHLDKLIPSYFCSWFGLIQIQKRADIEYPIHLTNEEIQFFIENDICTDIKKENFGLYKGKLVCLDYGQ